MVAAVLAAAAATAPAAGAAGELGLTVSGMPEQLIEGDVVTLTATVKNNDPTQIAADVRVNFIPQFDPFEDAPNLQGTACAAIAPPSLSCSLAGILQPGQSGQVRITSSLPALGLFAIDAGANGEVLNSDPFIPLTSPFPYPRWQANVEPKADIKLDFSAGAETVANGGNVTLKALVTNTTPEATAYGATVRFSIPPEVQVVDRPSDCTGTALSLTCPLGDLAPALTAQRLVTLRSTQQGAFTVLASTSWARPDPSIVDTQGQVSVTVLAPNELPDTGTGGDGTSPKPAPKPGTDPATLKPKAVSAGKLALGVPTTGRCLRTRRLNVVLRSINNLDPVRATIRLTGRKRALVLKGSRAQRPFVLKLPRRGKAVLRLAVTLENGRRYTATRTYRLC